MSQRASLKQLLLWAKITMPIGGALVIVGVVVGVMLGTRGPSIPSEYRHALDDIATVVIANGGDWEEPAPYPRRCHRATKNFTNK